MRRLHTGDKKCKGHTKQNPTQVPPRNDGSKETKGTCPRERQKPLSQLERIKSLDRKNQKRTLKKKRKRESVINHAVLPEEERESGTDIAQRAGTGKHGRRATLTQRRRKLAAEARVKTRRERRKTSVIKPMTNEDAPAAKTRKKKTRKNEGKRGNEKTEARKHPNNILKEVKRRSQKRLKRRITVSSVAIDREAKNGFAMPRGGPDRGDEDNAGSLATEGVTDGAAVAEMDDRLAGHGAESEIGLGIEGEMQKTKARGRVPMRQRAKRPEVETRAPKNVPLRNSGAGNETIDRALTEREGRATVEAAILKATEINRRSENGARARNQKTDLARNQKRG